MARSCDSDLGDLWSIYPAHRKGIPNQTFFSSVFPAHQILSMRTYKTLGA
jgi:hypothetical protein